MFKKVSYSLALLTVLMLFGCNSGKDISIRDAERFISNCATVVNIDYAANNTEEFSSDIDRTVELSTPYYRLIGEDISLAIGYAMLIASRAEKYGPGIYEAGSGKSEIAYKGLSPDGVSYIFNIDVSKIEKNDEYILKLIITPAKGEGEIAFRITSPQDEKRNVQGKITGVVAGTEKVVFSACVKKQPLNQEVRIGGIASLRYNNAVAKNYICQIEIEGNLDRNHKILASTGLSLSGKLSIGFAKPGSDAELALGKVREMKLQGIYELGLPYNSLFSGELALTFCTNSSLKGKVINRWVQDGVYEGFALKKFIGSLAYELKNADSYDFGREKSKNNYRNFEINAEGDLQLGEYGVAVLKATVKQYQFNVIRVISSYDMNGIRIANKTATYYLATGETNLTIWNASSFLVTARFVKNPGTKIYGQVTNEGGIVLANMVYEAGRYRMKFADGSRVIVL